MFIEGRSYIVSVTALVLKSGLRRYLEEKFPQHSFQDNECYSCNCDESRRAEFRVLLKFVTDYLFECGWKERHIAYWFNNFSLLRLRYDPSIRSIVPGQYPCFDLRAIFGMLDIAGSVDSYILSSEKAA
ncbi:hypothetical protein IT409_02680 [Candidatus Falkowbacteria bacterium]|nr:hypothetical protein [Candidatus Falkowbacteria bacterium]